MKPKGGIAVGIMKITIVCLAVLLHASMVVAGEGIHLGMDLGMLKPHDDLVTETFSDDFYIDGFLGYESAMGLEIRLGLGHYSEYSHHPDDEGFNTKISITPLHVDLIYNFFPRSKIRPFLGGGVGAYFYRFSDNFAGTIEDETVFAPSLAAGVNFEVHERFVVTVKYARHFIPAIPEIMFSDPNDFESSVFTIGFAFNLTPVHQKHPSKRAASSVATSSATAYRYNQAQEYLLVRIEQAERAIENKEAEKQQIETDIDALSKEEDHQAGSGDSSTPSLDRLTELQQKLSAVEKEIAELEDELDVLNEKWELIAYDGSPVVEHIYYLRQHCSDSPWGLRCRHGYFYYLGQPYGPDYFYDGYHHHPPHHEPPQPTPEQLHEYIEKRKEHIRRYKDRKPIGQDVNSGGQRAREEETRREAPQPAEPDQDEKAKHIDRYQNRN